MRLKKLSIFCFALSVLAFVLCIAFPAFFAESDAAAWQAFSVLAPICGISLLAGAILAVAAWLLGNNKPENKK